MHLLFLLAVFAATPAQHGAIEATIHGTNAPLEVELLVDDNEQWKHVAHETLPAATRHVRFDTLASGVYQLRVRGPQSTEQLGAKIAVGTGDTRRTTITIAPFALTGRLTLGGTNLGNSVIRMRHREMKWTGAIGVAADGTFRVPLWQRGTFDYDVRSPALPTDYAFWTDVDGSPLNIDIPDGRIQGIVRDAMTSAPVAGAIVGLQTNAGDREEHVRVTTNAEGKFDFGGVKDGEHIVRIFPRQHLEPDPIVFDLDDRHRLHELDVRVHGGRSVDVVVIDTNNDPAANAKIFAVHDANVAARTETDEDGRATVAVPDSGATTLFVIPNEGLFAVQRVTRNEKGRLKIHLPRTSSSLRIRATTTNGATMPPFSLLMRYNGEIVPVAVADVLTTVQGLQFMTGARSEAHLQNIPAGIYEFWPYRTDSEAESILEAASGLLAPIQVNVRAGENDIGVKFADRRISP